MKIELIKKTNPDGGVFYYIESDGKFVDNSAAINLEEANKLYERYITTKSLSITEVIKTTTIKDNEK